MAWIKRNLFFLIGSLVALLLIGCGGWFLYTQYTRESDITEQIKAKYEKLVKLTPNSTNNAGIDGGNPDNVKIARDQDAALKEYITKIKPRFQKIPPIPDTSSGKITPSEFPKQLDKTIAQLQSAAEQHKVQLPKEYSFTFQAQRNLMVIAAADVAKLSVQLGEIKSICDILFDAKINALDRILREPVSQTDTNPSDYLPPELKTISTNLADRTPYQVTFICFSGELATVMGSLAASPHAFVVKVIDVEPAAGAPSQGMVDLNTSPSPIAAPTRMAALPGGGRRGGPAGTSRNPTQFLTERPLRVNMILEIVKPK